MGDGGSGSNGQPAPAMKLGRRRVALAFIAVGLGALAITLLATAQTRQLQAGAREIAADMLTSVRLLGRLESEIRRRRILVDDHIFAQTQREMASLEAQIAAVDGEIAGTIREYQPWVTLPGEREVWDRTRLDLAALEPPIARALALSRQNRDAEARLEMDQVAAQWALVGQDLGTLIDINDRGAAESLSRFSNIRRRLMYLLLGLGGAGVVGTALAGRWAALQVSRREAEMIRHAKELEARNRDLDAFAGRVAHDVRGPLSTMKLALMPLAAKLPKDDRTLEILGRGVTRMEGLVEDLLTLARVETLAHGHCDPAAVVAEVQADFAPRIEAERGALRVSVAHADVSCSDGLLRQAVTNLVENAVKYHRPEAAPEVEISGGAADGGYDLRVSDNGVGLSAEEAGQVFQPFYRSPRIRDRPGTGLGLSIVNRVAEASGGRLSVRSTLGSGSTFVVHLPLAGAAGPGEGGRQT
jgi:signal transduction histidine kinase